MKRSQLIILLFSITVIIVFILSSRYSEKEGAFLQIESTPILAEIPVIKKGEPKSTPLVFSISENCTRFRQTIVAFEFNTLIERKAPIGFGVKFTNPKLLRKKLKSLITEADSCTGVSEDLEIHGLHTQLLMSCDSKVAFPGDLALCFQVFEIYRALLIDESTKDIPIQNLTDENILQAKLAAQFFGRPNPKNHSRVIAVADRLAEVSPEKRYQAFSNRMRYEQVLSETETEVKSRLREELDNRLSNVRSEKETPYAVELRVLLAKEAKDTDSMRELAMELKQHSLEDRGEYYLAWAEYLSDQKEESAKRLTELAKNSTDAVYALKQMQSKDLNIQSEPFTDIGLSWILPSE